MNDSDWHDRELSVFTIGVVLLRYRWRLVSWMIVGAILAVLPLLFTPPQYRASASFIPQGTDASRQGLAALAGQLGASLPGGNQVQSPEFYVMLLQSRELLQPIARDTFSVQGKRIPFFRLFDIDDSSEKRREEQAVALLKRITSASVDRQTGVVSTTSSAQWPEVAVGIARAMIDGLNAFNQRTRQTQAAVERRFVEGRLDKATLDLRAAEDRLESFLATNKQYENSAQLTFQRERLQREVSLKQQVFNSLTSSYEDVRIREVRDTPVITVVESPSVPAAPEPRGRTKRGILGLLGGAVLGIASVLLSEMMSRGNAAGDPAATEFYQMLSQMKGAGMRRRGKVAR